MNLIKIVRLLSLSLEFLRGMVWSVILVRRWRKLRIGRGLNVTGKLVVDKNVTIARNCRFYTNNTIGNSVFLGDNVELRCNGRNKIIIGNNCSINRNTTIIGNVLLKSNIMIAPSVTIAGGNHNFKDTTTKPMNQQGSSSKGIIIEDDVWIGANSVILDGVVIGKGSVIGAGSVVTKSIPPLSVAVGNPCKVIKTRN